MTMFEVPSPEEVWLFKCAHCGWHSDINIKQVHICSNCGQDVLYMCGTSEEIGDYLKKIMLLDS